MMSRAERRRIDRERRAAALRLKGAAPSPPAAPERSEPDPPPASHDPGQEAHLSAVDRLVAARAARVEVDRAEGVAWVDARREGHSWLVLGNAVGITRSAAQQRHASLVARFDLK